VGRLDKDSEGLLILTNDRKLNEALLHPSKQHRKTYIVQLDGDITDKAIAQAAKGVEIKLSTGTYKTKPCKVRKLHKPPIIPDRNPPIRFRQNIPTSWAIIEITEGKNRQVRKMFAKVGFPVLRLVRMQIEDLKLGKLEPGKYYAIEKKDILKLLNIDYSKPVIKKTEPTKTNRPPISKDTPSRPKKSKPVDKQVKYPKKQR
jgi:23S rRNA pseudouridine2457 synthase